MKEQTHGALLGCPKLAVMELQKEVAAVIGGSRGDPNVVEEAERGS